MEIHLAHETHKTSQVDKTDLNCEKSIWQTHKQTLLGTSFRVSGILFSEWQLFINQITKVTRGGGGYFLAQLHGHRRTKSGAYHFFCSMQSYNGRSSCPCPPGIHLVKRKKKKKRRHRKNEILYSGTIVLGFIKSNFAPQPKRNNEQILLRCFSATWWTWAARHFDLRLDRTVFMVLTAALGVLQRKRKFDALDLLKQEAVVAAEKKGG